METPLDPPLVDRERFFDDLDKMSFTELAKIYMTEDKDCSIITKVKSTMKRLMKHLGEGGSIVKILKYNRLRDILLGNFIAPYRYTAIQLSMKSRIKVSGVFKFGYKRIKGSHLESRLLVEENAQLEVQGSFNMFYGADIEVFKDAKLTIKGEGSANIHFTCICGEYIEIGKGVQIGRGVTIRDNNGNHYINRSGYKNSRPVIIGDKAWLCEGCTIMPGVKVGEGAIVGAHAFVTQNVPAHSVVSGNPAQVVDTDVLWKY